MGNWPPPLRCENCGWWQRMERGWFLRLLRAEQGHGWCKQPNMARESGLPDFTWRSYVCEFHTGPGDVKESIAILRRGPFIVPSSTGRAMSEVIKAYPLQWPTGWKRTQHRTRAQFSKSVYVSSTVPGGTGYSRKGDLSIHDGVTRVREELRRMGIRDDDIVISTNLHLRLDGLPKSGQAQPADPGAAVYWRTKGETRCMAIDQYDRVEHNLAAIAATLDAMRAIKRHGGAEILDRAFTGFAALPPPITGARPWRDVLGVAFDERDAGRITECYRISRSKAHPDKGGSSEAFQAVDRAYEQACRELGFTP